MQQRSTANSIGERLDEMKLVLPIDVLYQRGHLVDVNGVFYSIRLYGFGEIPFELDVN